MYIYMILYTYIYIYNMLYVVILKESNFWGIQLIKPLEHPRIP